MKIAITGSEGQIGTLLREKWGKIHDLKLFTLTKQPFSSCILDLSKSEDINGIFDNVEVLVHLAAEANPKAPWESVLNNNIVMIHNILEEAVRAKVKKIIFASTHHIQNGDTMIEMIPGSFDLDRSTPKNIDMNPDPDSPYAAAKLLGENLGRLYQKKYGISFIALRIGWVTLAEDPNQWIGGKWEPYLRNYFLSQKDCVSGFEAALNTEKKYLVAYLMSDNKDCTFDTKSSNASLNYDPVDNVDDIARKVVNRGDKDE